MKKQLIAGVLASTMVVAANAKVNITGKYFAKIDSSSTIKQELDLSIKATAGKSVVVTSLDLDDSGSGLANNFSVSETYLKTRLAGIRINAGKAKGQKGKGLIYGKSTSNRLKLSKRVSGITGTLTSTSGESNMKVDLSGKFAGARVTVQDALNDGRTVTISGASKIGFSGLVEHNNEATAYQLTTNIAGLSASVVKIEANANVVTQKDGVFGNIENATDVSGVILSTDTSYGKITAKSYDVDGAKTNKATLKVGNFDYTVSKSGSNDATMEAKFSFKF